MLNIYHRNVYIGYNILERHKDGTAFYLDFISESEILLKRKPGILHLDFLEYKYQAIDGL